MSHLSTVCLILTVMVSSLYAVPEVGKPAPDITLYRLDTDEMVSISQFRGKQMVVLTSGNLC